MFDTRLNLANLTPNKLSDNLLKMGWISFWLICLIGVSRDSEAHNSTVRLTGFKMAQHS
jgi:hypothetical protein